MRKKSPAPILFVHLPKTGGTSFRRAIGAYLKKRVAWDYGPEAKESADFLPPSRARLEDSDRILRELEKRHIRLLGGHFAYEKYADIFPPERVITFLRHPVERVVSEYFHHQRKGRATGSLLEFASRRRNRNLQSRMLHGAPPDEIGVLGISERYRDSLELIRERLGWDLEYLRSNTNPDRKRASDEYPLDDETRSRIGELNARDMALYEFAEAGFVRDPRSRPPRPPPPATSRAGNAHGCKGAVRWCGSGEIAGWAVVDGGREDCRVAIHVNGEPVEVVSADGYRSDLLDKELHRSGHGGFRVRVGALAPGSKVRAFIEGQGVELVNSPLVVPDA